MMTAQESFGHEVAVHRDLELQEQIAQLLHERLHVDVQDPRKDLFETGIIDSLGLVELLLGLESEFGVRTDTEDLDIDNFRSLQRAALYVMRHEVAGGSPTP
jgi:methoxymalonate biosynthesis acyl carrier protein